MNKHIIYFCIIIFVFIFHLLWIGCNSSSFQNYLSNAEIKTKFQNENKALKRGQEIWFDPGVGSNGLACESCHPKGELTNAESYPRYKHVLRTMASISMTHNFAVVNESKGEPWEIGSFDANALVLYVKALANGKSMRMARPNTYKKEWVSKGRNLFSNTKLGSNGKSCASCHTNEENDSIHFKVKRLKTLKGSAAIHPKYSFRRKEVSIIEQEINFCIKNYLDGELLKLNEEKMIALLCYVTSLSEGKKVSVIKIQEPKR